MARAADKGKERQETGTNRHARIERVVVGDGGDEQRFFFFVDGK